MDANVLDPVLGGGVEPQEVGDHLGRDRAVRDGVGPLQRDCGHSHSLSPFKTAVPVLHDRRLAGNRPRLDKGRRARRRDRGTGQGERYRYAYPQSATNTCNTTANSHDFTS